MSEKFKCACGDGKYVERERMITIKPLNKTMTKVFLKCKSCGREIETLEQWAINRKRYVACAGYYE